MTVPLPQGRAALGSFVLLPSPESAELHARCGYDFLLIDAQHGLFAESALHGLITAVELAGALPIVRVASGDHACIGRALDLGARAVVVPMVSTAAEAASAVAGCRYLPHGRRSYGPIRLLHTGRAAEPVGCFAMVETAEGVADVDAIAATPGLTGVFVGPTDLAISLGLPADHRVEDPVHDGAIQRVADACRRHGIAAAIQTSSAAEAQHRISQGYTLVSLRSDVALLTSASRDIAGSVRTATEHTRLPHRKSAHVT
ncbi:HpcH/HpaI aldolase family protein [Streptomyces acidiscabies]|uniref:Aldolase/citrate lyase family protein n=1 Tax=Streptomyces acidiscabies TaxID=42234 RepID=A0AAP6BB62_9ACTN|nr:aldolase/citrate lyase family protein [Streptomyces acidiscabies]MBZ3917165.1 hypothetical protein [Streptomyces acidiscabies]MDX2961405.1 aldolase/citrate lyase family protein [Streptomyces acidiscabies]MDX3022763.1 aldolase/citrate lyase family protein [Streptomyces acidiscabies]MDX3792127.1 aldolase/citrate lyase family protein [Streptomyces acidiscabies]GAQ50982.1 4-hydroxy-2-oxovalerate aldolase [Streptomyces acidiscabies]